jgi:dTDP-4-amino-4,6-dideoxygalactose transaminase
VTEARRIPFLRPRPARLSRCCAELAAIEASGIYSNSGPVNARFESELTTRIFAGRGGCLTVANATLGLIIAIRESTTANPQGRYAVMPSFTFAATAHAAIWAGLIPLFVDIDAQTWSVDPASEDEQLRRYGHEVACVVPHACFGNGIDLDRYARLARDRSVGVVVDAAASLGTLDGDGRGFGAGFRHPVVFSMHATKPFATGEGGVIHSGDLERLGRLRTMANFGFGEPKVATMPGLNAKLDEVGALQALVKLDEFEAVAEHRARLAALYRARLSDLQFQRAIGRRLAYQFMPVLLPPRLRHRRAAVVSALEESGVGCRTYFSPHLAEQPYFAGIAAKADLTITQQIADGMLSLPMADDMTEDEVELVCDRLLAVIEEVG